MRFFQYARVGGRRNYERPYSDRREKLADLVLAECVEGRGRFIDAVVDGACLILTRAIQYKAKGLTAFSVVSPFASTAVAVVPPRGANNPQVPLKNAPYARNRRERRRIRG